MKWEYNLVYHGKALRETINNGSEDLASCKETLTSLAECYKQIHKIIPENDWLDEFEGELDTIIGLIEIFNMDDTSREEKLFDLRYDGWNPPLEAVNDSLRVFYDLCDSYRIWAGL